MSDVESRDAYLAHRVGAQLRTTRWRLAFVASALAGVLAGVWFEHGTGARIVLAAVLAIAFPVALFLWLSRQQDQFAEADLLTAWGRSHDLRFADVPDLGRGTPLLREGDVQLALNGLTGTLDGLPLLLCQYTYTIVEQTPGEPNAEAPFTLVRVRGLKTPINRLTLHPIAGLDRANPAEHGPAIKGDRIVELESSDLHRHYRLEVQRDVPDVAVRQLFEPSFVVWCVDQGDVLFELERGELVVALREHLSDGEWLEFLLERSRFVLQRVLDAFPHRG
jgi:hypothetical protein